MRDVSGAVAALIQQKLGLEPVNIVEIQWVPNGSFLLYADKEIPEAAGKILEIGTLESVVKLDSQGLSDALQIKLSDTDGVIKSILNTTNPHGRVCRVSQWFTELPIFEKFVLFEGQISSQIIWSEGDRTLDFEVITQLSDKEVGFSPEEGNFAFIPDHLVGVPWPLAFGHVQNVPAVTLQEFPQTQSAEALSIVDPSLLERINELNELIAFLQGFRSAVILPALAGAADHRDNGQTLQERQYGEELYNAINAYQSQFVEAELSAGIERSRLQQDYQDQLAEQRASLEVINGRNFPQNTPITIVMGDSNNRIELAGTMSGDTFTITDRILLRWLATPLAERTERPFGFTFKQAGSSVRIKTDAPIIYIVNIVPTEVHAVAAFMRLENSDELILVPTNLYTINSTTIGPYTITYLTFNEPLSSFDERFQNEIFVTQTSAIGPDIVEILEWAINTYTNLSIDDGTFDNLHQKSLNYPCNFYLSERKNIIQFLEEIAFQARAALWIKEGTVYAKYLSEEPTSVDTITEEDIDAGSLVLETTHTEELVTKLTSTWTDDYSKPDPYTLITRHNIERYGTREREINFYIYNIGELVAKSATFWMIRLSNVWKHIKFKTYLHKIRLEPFDCVTFDFADNYVANGPIKGLITRVTYNSEDNILDIEAWLPVRLGEMTQYPFAWPGEIDPDTNLFPTNVDIAQGYAGGNGPGAEVEGGFELPEGLRVILAHRTFQDYADAGERFQAPDYGDLKPSDLDDVAPTIAFAGKTFEVSDDPGFQSEFGNYPVPPFPSTQVIEFSSVFPGQITGRVDNNTYTVNIFNLGLANPPISRPVRQLQIAPPGDGSVEEIIPNGTWVLVAQNVIDPEELTIEWTMQVPVWL